MANDAQMTADVVRKWNLRYLADKSGGVTRIADRIKRSQSQVSQLIGKTPSKSIEKRLARHIEDMLKLDPGWLDDRHVNQWLSIRRPDWRSELSYLLLRNSIVVTDDSAPADGSKDEIELLSIYRLLDDADRARLSSIARTLLGP